jgi:hypothetical protein
MQRFSSFPSYKVLDRTTRVPDKEVGDRIFVGARHLEALSENDRMPSLPGSTSGAMPEAVVVAARTSPPTTPSTVARWAQEKRHEAEFLPVPRLPQPSPREPHVLLVDTPTS